MPRSQFSIEDAHERISKFIPQMKEDMCFSACILNAINDLGERLEINKCSFSLKQMNRICGYREALQCDEAIIPQALNDALRKYKYIWKEKDGPTTKFEDIIQILDDPRNSIPVIGVSYRYFEEIDIHLSGRRNYDHALNILHISDDEIYFYDPYEKFFKRKGSKVEVPRTINKSKFINIWGMANRPRYLGWAEPKEKVNLVDFFPKNFDR